MKDVCEVYWIRHRNHSDILSEGYIGITVGGGSVMVGRKHTNETKKKIGEKAKGRYCSDFTRKLRSELSRGRKHTEATKESLRVMAKERLKDREYQLQIKQAILKASEVNKNKQSWENPFADINTWIIADKIYYFIKENPDKKMFKVARNFNIKGGKLQVIYKKIINGWNPLEDENWILFKDKFKNKE